VVVTFKDVQRCINVFSKTHGRIDKLIVVNSFKNIPKIEEMKQEKKELVKEAFFSVLAPAKKTFFHIFHDPMERYMENLYNQNL
jgi:hypothetical protein